MLRFSLEIFSHYLFDQISSSLLSISTKIDGLFRKLVNLIIFILTNFADFNHFVCQKCVDNAEIFDEKISKILMKIKDYLGHIFDC